MHDPKNGKDWPLPTINIYGSEFDTEAVQQVCQIARLQPFKSAHIAIMPDFHVGKGCVIGFTVDATNEVIPNVVGVDVGCGLLAVELAESKTDELLQAFDNAAYKRVPSGHDLHTEAKIDEAELDAYECKFKRESHLLRSLGTLGGGNHFIELDEAPNGKLWLVVHTGSRNLGLQVANWWQEIAIQQRRGATASQKETLVKSLKAQGRETEIASVLKKLKEADLSVPKDQCWLEGDERDGYLHDMGLAQVFAQRNRNAIVEALFDETGAKPSGERIESVHNYIDLEHNVVRKGAIAAYENQRLIIPLNMAAGCIIGKGKGNASWNNSAPHGAGRAMSRAEARRNLKLEDYQASMEGIYSTSVSVDTLDEAPAAYKDAVTIEDDIADTVDVEFIMKPVWNFKASN